MAEQSSEVSGARRIRLWGWRQVLGSFAGAFAAWMGLSFVLPKLVPNAAVGLSVATFYGLIALMTALSIGKSRAAPSKKLLGRSTIRVTKDAVEVDGAIVAQRSDIVSGMVLPSDDGSALVELTLAAASGGKIALAVPSTRDGRAVLDALELDTAHHIGIAKVRMPYLAQALAAYFCGELALGLVMGLEKGHKTLFGYAMLTLVPFILASLIAIFIPGKAIVGTDGIVVQWLHFFRRFIPMRDIATVGLLTGVEGRLVVNLKSGRRQEIPTRYLNRRGALPRTIALRDRINEALDRARRGGEERDLSRVLLRASEDVGVGQWVKRLREVLKGSDDFRRAAMPADDLWNVVEDARADEQKRAVAAVALSSAIDDPGRQRLRIAASSSVAPRLRIALEAAATNDESEMEAALEAFADDEARAEAST